MDEPSLRQLLEDTPPHHFKRSAAWKALVQANRERRRARGESPFIAGQRDVQRALDAVPRGAVDPHRLVDAKEGLKLLCQAVSLDPEARMDLAARVDAALRELAPTLVSDPVSVVVTGWPQGFGPALRRRVLQVAVDPPGPYAPAEAARLVRDIDGLVLAGSTLGVAPQLAPFTALPPVPRSQRADKGRWGRGGPWLPYGDGEGRYSLTPRHLALAQARLVGERPVLDAMQTLPAFVYLVPPCAASGATPWPSRSGAPASSRSSGTPAAPRWPASTSRSGAWPTGWRSCGAMP